MLCASAAKTVIGNAASDAAAVTTVLVLHLLSPITFSASWSFHCGGFGNLSYHEIRQDVAFAARDAVPPTTTEANGAGTSVCAVDGDE